MLSFESDYIMGAHEKVLERLMKTNMEPLSGYGNDVYTERAKEKIKKACGCADAEVYFLTGGTQTNQVVIASMLKSYEGVIAAKTGHINSHEAGAIEYVGHKVLELPEHNGKIAPTELRKYLENFYRDDNHEHMVFPGMVYISHPTEYGTLYAKEELKEISSICHSFNIPLYVDGARLGYGLMSKQTDVTLFDLTVYCDVFYIGGTKMGALCGEAIVFPKKNMPKYFMTIAKQHGALLAKGRVLGVQFDALFTDNLYFKLGKQAIETAEELKRIFTEKGYPFYLESPTNQQFIILTDEQAENLQDKVKFGFWERLDENRIVVRFATGWATTKEDIEKLEALL